MKKKIQKYHPQSFFGFNVFPFFNVSHFGILSNSAWFYQSASHQTFNLNVIIYISGRTSAIFPPSLWSLWTRVVMVAPQKMTMKKTTFINVLAAWQRCFHNFWRCIFSMFITFLSFQLKIWWFLSGNSLCCLNTAWLKGHSTIFLNFLSLISRNHVKSDCSFTKNKKKIPFNSKENGSLCLACMKWEWG